MPSPRPAARRTTHRPSGASGELPDLREVIHMGAAIFALAALLLLAWSAWLTWRAMRHRDLLRESTAIMALGLSGALAYEATELATGREPTISMILAQEFARHPLEWLAWFLPVVVLVGALTFHFVALRRQARWFVFAAGGMAYLLG